ATYIKIKGAKGNIGFISAINHKFCSSCNRIRLTKEGFLKLCLHWKSGIDLKSLIREGINEEELTKIIKNAIEEKPEEHDFKHIKENSEENYDNRKMFQIGG
ncbi:MAG: GTP 3',8-cyclase MoaA, partial [Sarcina sp.]